MAKTCRIILQMGILLNIIMLSSGNLTDGHLTDVVVKLGWKRILMVSENNLPNTEAMSLARNGIQVSSTDNACKNGPSLDGSVIDMRHFNETLLLKSIQCGRPGMNCLKIGLPGKPILCERKGLREVLFS